MNLSALLLCAALVLAGSQVRSSVWSSSSAAAPVWGGGSGWRVRMPHRVRQGSAAAEHTLRSVHRREPPLAAGLPSPKCLWRLARPQLAC